MKVTILPYKKASKSAGELAKALEIKYLRNKESKYKSKEGRSVINWGSSLAPPWYTGDGTGSRVINPFESVEVASNKHKSLIAMREGGVNVPDFTDDASEVRMWLEESPNRRFMGRTLLKGSSGAGCYFLSERADDHKEGGGDVTIALEGRDYKLFTDYIPKTAEYRVHVMNGEVFDITQKKSKSDGLTAIDYKIRSHDRGWVFCREDIEYPGGIKEEAILAVKSLSLDFGAVDIIWNRNKGIFVLEVNTAPGLEGTTLENYIAAFKEFLL